jgi:DNA-binding NarL/FixJ family response regulator
MKNIRILLCDDHALFRSGVASLLKDEPGYFIVGEAENGKEMIEKFDMLKPDVVIADISMPGASGIDAAKEINRKYANIKIIFLTMLQDEEYIYLAIKAGGLGLINKNIVKGELLYAIKEVSEGREYFGPNYSTEIIDSIVAKYSHPQTSETTSVYDELTHTEKRILECIAEDMSSAEIADKLCLGKRTIDSYRARLIDKYNLKSLHGLIKFALLYVESKNIT